MPNTSPVICTININLFAGPGVGKSVTAAALFVALKMRGVNAALVTEFAKDQHYDGLLADTPQATILEEQYRRQARLQGKVQVAITDAPVPMTLAYAPAEHLPELKKQLHELVGGWHNLNILLHRDLRQGYETAGRYQPLEAAIAFHQNHLAPVLRDFYRDTLVDCAVESAVQLLTEQVLELLAQAENSLCRATSTAEL